MIHSSILHLCCNCSGVYCLVGDGEKAGVSLTGCNELQPTHDAMHEKIKSGKKNLFLHFYLTAYLPFRHIQQLYLTANFVLYNIFVILDLKGFSVNPLYHEYEYLLISNPPSRTYQLN